MKHLVILDGEKRSKSYNNIKVRDKNLESPRQFIRFIAVYNLFK